MRWLDGITHGIIHDSMDMNLGRLGEMVGIGRLGALQSTNSQTRLGD